MIPFKFPNSLEVPCKFPEIFVDISVGYLCLGKKGISSLTSAYARKNLYIKNFPIRVGMSFKFPFSLNRENRVINPCFSLICKKKIQGIRQGTFREKGNFGLYGVRK